MAVAKRSSLACGSLRARFARLQRGVQGRRPSTENAMEDRRTVGVTGVDRLFVAVALALGLATHGIASAAEPAAEPLAVPRDALPTPESLAGEDAAGRIDAAARVLRARSYRELPVLARGMLALSDVDPVAAERALALAPGTPAIAFEVGRRLGRPTQVARSLWLLGTTLPGVVWLVTWGGVTLCIGWLFVSVALVALAFARASTLLGHAGGHWLSGREPAAWPALLLCLALLGGLALLGVGPLLWLAAAGALVIAALPRREAATVATALLVAGALCGPGLTLWMRVATFPAREPGRLAAWRLERGQPLPGDLERIAGAAAQHPDDGVLRLALATAAKRAGDLDAVERALAGFEPSDPVLRSRVATFAGTLALARGDVAVAIAAFERARQDEASAAVIYNLSQAHGRALNLSEQASLFATARALDPELVQEHGLARDASIHRYLAEQPLPLRTHLAGAWAPSREATRAERALRHAALGATLPDASWLALPVLALLALLLPRSAVRRCGRCLRLVCERCNDEPSSTTCLRCARLFVPTAVLDARVRREQIDRDRARQRWIGRGLALGSLVLPGAAHGFEGRLPRATAILLPTALGLGAWLAAPLVPTPSEVGALATALPAGVAVVLAGPVWLGSTLLALQRLVLGRRA